MIAKVGTYNHLGPIKIPIDMKLLASVVDKENYGLHRFLSEWLKICDRKKHTNRLVNEIERLLNQGEW